MNIPGVTITLANGQIGGAPTTTDRVVGLIGTGSGLADAVDLLMPFRIVSLADAMAQGFTEAAEPYLYRHLKEFYDIAPIGSKIYVMAVSNATSLAAILDKTNVNGAAVKLLNFAAGEIKVLGVVREPDEEYVPATPQFIDSDAIAALVNAKTLVQEYFNGFKPFRVLIGARVHDVANSTLYNPGAQSNNAAALVVGGTLPDGSPSVGLVLGKVSSTPVHRNIGRVKDGALPVTTMYIGNKKIDDYAGIVSLIANRFLTFVTYPQKAGYFISDDPMATTMADDYRFLVNCRVIDKAAVIAYHTYLEELKDDVDLDEKGAIAEVNIKHLEAVVINNLMLAMSDSISGEPKVYINPAQNLAAGSKLQVQLRLVPKGYLREINVELGFSNPAN